MRILYHAIAEEETKKRREKKKEERRSGLLLVRFYLGWDLSHFFIYYFDDSPACMQPT
jgi:hypothetical protein